MRRLYLFISLLFIIVSCDKGLSPDLAKEKSGFGGTITFIGKWNPEVNQTHVVVFRNPLLSQSDFNVFNLSFVSESIPNGSHEYIYSTSDESALISTIEAGIYSYIAVAQSSRDSITLTRKDWHVVGLYYSLGDSTAPGILTIPQSSFLEGINIKCDFNNPPPQPPGGILNVFKKVLENNFIGLSNTRE